MNPFLQDMGPNYKCTKCKHQLYQEVDVGRSFKIYFINRHTGAILSKIYDTNIIEQKDNWLTLQITSILQDQDIHELKNLNCRLKKCANGWQIKTTYNPGKKFNRLVLIHCQVLVKFLGELYLEETFPIPSQFILRPSRVVHHQ